MAEWHGEERRKRPRVRIVVPIELRMPSQQYGSKGETSDISASGLYHSTMQQLPVGTEVILKIGLGEEMIECRAIAKTSDPGVGNGFEFLNLDAASQEKLARYLEAKNEVG